jgi:hypothetical protein
VTFYAVVTSPGPLRIVYLYAPRVIVGMGTGGEYAAINSAIDEMMTARYRGPVRKERS